MRILSPSLDVPTPRNETTHADSMTNRAPETTSVATTPSTGTAHAVSSAVPTVALDTDAVSDNMAARLCISFLGHVLFLKNQVPFPIVQLARMPTSDNTTRAAKKRHELLNSFDTLASHLYTTFIALSTALALRSSPEKAELGTESQKHGVAKAFFAVALGPTVGTAKSRVIVGIDGLETKVWGLREDTIPVKEVVRIDDGSEEADDNPVEDVSDADEDEQSEGEASEGSSEEIEDASVSDDDESLPPSRSPSPTPSSDSDTSPSTSPRNVPSKSPLLRTEDPETVRAAERLLSRTLASACAEDDGHGLASEMAPTHIHVLLRAPRRFDHPSWIPRQNLCASLDSHLAAFLEESGEALVSCDATRKKRTKASNVQGVWVKSRGTCAPIKSSEEDLAEEDEMIWWSWDGKLVGFSDW